MDTVTRHEAQRLARDAFAAFFDLAGERDPRTGYVHLHADTITPRVLSELADKAIGRVQPLTVEVMQQAVLEAAETPR